MSAKWDKRWMDQCEFIEKWSGDTSKQTSAVVVNERNVLLTVGWNDLPRGVTDNDHRRTRPHKYKWTEHAERNAIYNAAAEGIALKGSVMYLPWYPCADCARAIVQSGIVEIVCVEPNWNDERWGPDWKISNDMLAEAGVRVRYMSGRVQK